MKRFALAVLVVLAPALVWAQKTSFDFDKTAKFATFKTYAMKEGTPVGNPLMDQRITDAIEAQLATKGLTKSAMPDVFVTYHVALDKQKDITAWSTGGGPYGWGWGAGWGTTDVRVYDVLVGSLIIDAADAKTNQMVWRGMGVKELDTNAKADKRDKNVTKAVEKILKNFPPPVKK
jgi:uncharacterized protein DUF4136